MTENCLFCKIVKGEIPAIKIWEDKNHIAFLDMKPINPGHLLVIPKNHKDYVFDLSDKDYSKLMLKAKEIAKDLKSKMKSKGYGHLESIQPATFARKRNALRLKCLFRLPAKLSEIHQTPLKHSRCR